MGAKVVAIIPARGGSKGIPRKNIRNLANKPLLAHTIEAARNAKLVDTVITSTDDNEIAAVALRYDSEVVIRPPELATDGASSESALLHVLRDLETRGITPEIVVFLQCTSPLMTSDQIDESVRRILEGYDSAISVTEDYGYYWQKNSDGTIDPMRSERQMRQDMEPWYCESGAFYTTKTELLLKTGNRYSGRVSPVVVPAEQAIQIDEPYDLWLMERYFEYQGEQ
jgi:CMP-N,N'-diacetyllegionaminic acid synthase